MIYGEGWITNSADQLFTLGWVSQIPAEEVKKIVELVSGVAGDQVIHCVVQSDVGFDCDLSMDGVFGGIPTLNISMELEGDVVIYEDLVTKDDLLLILKLHQEVDIL